MALKYQAMNREKVIKDLKEHARFHESSREASLESFQETRLNNFLTSAAVNDATATILRRWAEKARTRKAFSVADFYAHIITSYHVYESKLQDQVNVRPSAAVELQARRNAALFAEQVISFLKNVKSANQ